MEEHSPVDLTFEEPNPQAKNFFDTLSTTNNSLYAGCKNYSQMSIIGRMANLKTDHNCSEKMYNDMCILMRKALPQPNSMTSSFYDTKKRIVGLWLPLERIIAALMGIPSTGVVLQMLDTAEHDRQQVGLETMLEIDIYLPIGPQLQQLYASQVTAGEMRWHVEHHIEEG